MLYSQTKGKNSMINTTQQKKREKRLLKEIAKPELAKMLSSWDNNNRVLYSIYNQVNSKKLDPTLN